MSSSSKPSEGLSTAAATRTVSSSSSSSSPSWHRCGLELVDRLDVRRLHSAVVWEVWVVHAAGQWSVGHSVAAGQLDHFALRTWSVTTFSLFAGWVRIMVKQDDA